MDKEHNLHFHVGKTYAGNQSIKKLWFMNTGSNKETLQVKLAGCSHVS